MKKCWSLKFDRYLNRYIYWGLNSCSIDTISIKIYEIGIFRFDFRPMLTCMCRVYFFTTLDIYKAYFKGRHIREYKENTCKKWPSALFSLKKILHLCAWEFCNQMLLDLHCWWSEEPCNQHLLQVGEFVTYWELYIIG